MIATGYHPDWDIRRKEGSESEVWVDLLGTKGAVTIEVKAEIRWWPITHRMAFEYRSRSKLSGLSITKSQYWAVPFLRDKVHVGLFVFDTERLKRNLARLRKEGRVKWDRFGDIDPATGLRSSVGHLVPISMVEELFK